MTKILDIKAFDELKDQLNAYKDSGKIDMDKVETTLKSIEKNDQDEEKKKEDEKIQEQLNKLTEIAEEQRKINSKLPSMADEDNTISPDKWYMNTMSKDELKQFARGDEKANSERYNQIGMARYVNAMYKKFKNVASEDDHKYLNALNSTLTDAAGNYLLPIPTLNLIFDDLSESGLFFSETTVIDFQKGQGKKKKIPTLAAGDHPDSAITKVTEGDPKPVGNFVFGQIDLELKKYAVLIPMTDELIEDGMEDIVQVIRNYAGDYYGILFDNFLFNGDAGNITGLAGMSTTGTPTSGTGISSLTLDDMIMAVGGLRSVDLRNAKWYMSPSMWSSIFTKKSEQDSHYFLDLRDFGNKSIFGYPVVMTDFAPAYTASASAATKYIYFGNLKKVFVGRKAGINIDVSNVASYVDGSAHTHHSFQDNETVVRLETRIDMDCAFPSRIVDIRTKA